VDNKHDLNVYTDAREDGTKNSCCGKSSSLNCGKKDESTANGLGASPSHSKDVDFNEWAGMWPAYKRAVCGLHADNAVHRLVPSLCHKTIGLNAAEENLEFQDLSSTRIAKRPRCVRIVALSDFWSLG
jgi:hypothetical protein